MILTPYELPDMHGDRLCQEVRTAMDLPPVAVVMFAPREAAPREHARLLAAGADGYIPFPLEPEDFVLRIRSLLKIDKLHLSHQKPSEDYREMLETTPLPYQSLDANGCLVQVNKAWLNTLGYEDESEVLGRPFSDFLPPREAPNFPQRFRLFKQSGQICCLEFTMRKKDGSTIQVSFDGRIARDTNGEFIKTHCIFQEIKSRHHLWKKSLFAPKSFQKFYWKTRAASALVFLTGAGLLALLFAPLTTREWQLGLALVGLILVITLLASLHFVRKMLSIIAYYHNQVDQREQSLKLISENLESQVKQRTSELTQSERRYRTYVSASPMAIMVTDATGRFVDVNPAACTWLGYTRDQFLRRSVTDIFAPEDQQYGQQEHNRLVTHSRLSGEYVFVHQKGAKIPVSLEGVALENNTYMVFCQDISQRKAIEEELQHTEKIRLEEAMKMQKLESVGTLAGGIAHDFNNILMGIFGNIELAKYSLPSGHPSRTSLQRAERSLDRAVHLSTQLLTFSKGGEPIKETTGLADLLKDIARFDLSGSPVKPVFTIDPDLWDAHVDKGQIQQVFSNLTINAKQAMPDGGSLYFSLENRILAAGEIPSLAPGKYIRITVKDEGAGIPPKHLSRIFDPYFSTKQTGSGLGLATVYAIISKHKGHIAVETEPDKGTVFTIHLPASTKGVAQQTPSPSFQDITPTGQGRILVMDDEQLILGVMEEMLSALGYDVDTASNGQETLHKYQQAMEAHQPYTAVIMDLIIPGGMGGKEAISHLLVMDPQARVIVSSGFAADSTMAQATQLGFKAVISKPYTLKTLQTVLNKVINA
jgi:PAS domain S-box-containing protein